MSKKRALLLWLCLIVTGYGSWTLCTGDPLWVKILVPAVLWAVVAWLFTARTGRTKI